MKKVISQISVSLVCCILGFMVAYQFKMLNRRSSDVNVNKTSTDVTVEIEQYKKQKDQLEQSVEDLQAKIKKYEESAASSSDTTKNILAELQDTRTLLGNTDVQGQGIVIYLTPLTNLVGNDVTNDQIDDKHLAYLVNELNFAGAEAISINDIRLTSRSGIRNSGSYIIINSEKISPQNPITIKAIGDKNLLYGAMSFPEVFDDFKTICDVKYEKSDSLKIPKYNKTYKLEYAKPAK